MLTDRSGDGDTMTIRAMLAAIEQRLIDDVDSGDISTADLARALVDVVTLRRRLGVRLDLPLGASDPPRRCPRRSVAH